MERLEQVELQALALYQPLLEPHSTLFRTAALEAQAARQVLARNSLQMEAAAALAAVSTTAGLVVATRQELQQEALVELQPHSSGARSRNLAPLAAAARLLALRYQATQLLALQLDLRCMQACRMWRCLALERLEATQQTPQALVHSRTENQHWEPVRLAALHSLQAAVVAVAVALQTTEMTSLLVLRLSPHQPQVGTAVAVAVVQVLRGVVAMPPAQGHSLLATAAALRRIRAEAAVAAAVWCSANTRTALWSQAKQGQVAQARRVPYISGGWANE